MTDGIDGVSVSEWDRAHKKWMAEQGMVGYDCEDEARSLIRWNREQQEKNQKAAKKFRSFLETVEVGDGVNSKYNRTITGKNASGEAVYISVDVYDVLNAWEVKNPALQHLLKKTLQAGKRGHKDLAEDLNDIIDSAIRARELEGF